MADSAKPKAVLIAHSRAFEQVFPSAILEAFSGQLEWTRPHVIRECPPSGELGPFTDTIPPETEIIVSTWGMPELSDALLESLPNLKVVFYAAGSVRYFISEKLWDRGIRVFSAASANALPVAEFTVAQLILGLKMNYKIRLTDPALWGSRNTGRGDIIGNYRSRVGLISYGAIARHVRFLLRSFNHEIRVYDPFLSEADAKQAGVTLCSLEEIFAECDAVSLHTPLLDSTRGMIRGYYFRSMRKNATFINTARGAVINQPEMVEALRERTDLTAILDVVDPEPPPADDPLFSLPNVWVTPHIAGSMGPECARMGTYMLEALQSYLDGKHCRLEVNKADMTVIA